MTTTTLTGDCRELLPTLREGSVQCCVTSPPYFGLRDYKTGTWAGGDPACRHVVGQMRRGLGLAASVANTRGGARKVAPDIQARSVCPHCGARRHDKQIGLEDSPEEYVAELVKVFREVRRVLRDDGTLWLNIGDSYARDPKKGGTGTPNGRNLPAMRYRGAGLAGAKLKDLIGIPWMLAFALRADGWWLRSDVIWHKTNPMPESVKDRPISAHEHVFMLTKSKEYFYNFDAVLEDGVYPAGTLGGKSGKARAKEERVNSRPAEYKVYSGKRSLRNVWTIASEPYRAADADGEHFAVMPSALAERCILAGSREGDTVLDPFGGVGTTALAASRLQRAAILIELRPQSQQAAKARVFDEAPLLYEEGGQP